MNESSKNVTAMLNKLKSKKLVKSFRKKLVIEFSVTLATGVSLNIEPDKIIANVEYYQISFNKLAAPPKPDAAPGPVILLSYAARYYREMFCKQTSGVSYLCKFDDIPDLITGMVSNADHMPKDSWICMFDKTFEPELLSGTFDGDDYFNKVATDPALYADLDTNDYHNNVLNYKAFMLSALAKQILSGELVE